jgi:hypothetical protein
MFLLHACFAQTAAEESELSSTTLSIGPANTSMVNAATKPIVHNSPDKGPLRPERSNAA